MYSVVKEEIENGYVPCLLFSDLFECFDVYKG